MVSQKLILELQQIIKEEYGKELSISDVSEIANGMVGYFNLLAKIHHRDVDKSGNSKPQF